MRVASALISVLALAGAGAARVSRRAVDEDARPSNDTAVAPKKFIVELEQVRFFFNFLTKEESIRLPESEDKC